MAFIEDPASRETVSVSPTGRRQNVSSRSDGRIYYISRDNGDAYTTISEYASAVAGEYVLYFKNTSTTQDFYVTSVGVGSAVLAKFKLAVVTGTPSGTDIEATNLNLTSGNTATTVAMGNGAVTGLTEVSVIGSSRVPAESSGVIKLKDALILGQGDAIAMEYDAGAGGAVDVTLIGFFDAE